MIKSKKKLTHGKVYIQVIKDNEVEIKIEGSIALTFDIKTRKEHVVPDYTIRQGDTLTLMFDKPHK